MRNTDVAARITSIREFTGKEFTVFGAEGTVGDKLARFADLSEHLESGGKPVRE
jgi:hypothetical protein